MNTSVEQGAMEVDLSRLEIAATKPDGEPGRLLAGMGVQVRGVEQGQDEHVDRYFLSPRVAVERRSGAAFLRGIQDKTLFTSAIYLGENFGVPALILEGEVDYEYTSFDPRAVRGALSALMLQYGVSVLSSPTPQETAALLAMMARQEQFGIPEISLVPKRRALDLADMQRRVVEMLPGCGLALARGLLQHFGCVRRIVGATESELCKVRGLGPAKASEVVRVVEAEYEAVDTERDLEDAIEFDHTLLFTGPVQLLARQHYLFSDEHGRQFVDMVFLDRAANQIVLVELKRGRLTEQHGDQLRRYMDNAVRCDLLRGLLQKGTGLRGLLATVQDGQTDISNEDIEVCVVDRGRVIDALLLLRRRRLNQARNQEG